MAVVKSPKNTKRRKLWIKSLTNKSLTNKSLTNNFLYYNAIKLYYKRLILFNKRVPSFIADPRVDHKRLLSNYLNPVNTARFTFNIHLKFTKGFKWRKLKTWKKKVISISKYTILP